jgi:hypothetical protein
MKYKILPLVFILSPILLNAQFEQKVSINFSVGGFKTIGYEMGEYEYDPLQMPHYRPGIIAEAGFQYNISRRISVMAAAGIMYSGSWSFMIGDYDYLHYTISDPETEDILAEGLNELNLFNFSIGVYPKYYLLPSKKWNPYIFAGLNINFTQANYTDNWWIDANDLDQLPPDDTGPYSPFLEKNTGIGFIPGIGIEYSRSDRFKLTFTSGYYLIELNEENFKNQYVIEDFNAFFLQIGVRLSFLKSKNL